MYSGCDGWDNLLTLPHSPCNPATDFYKEWLCFLRFRGTRWVARIAKRNVIPCPNQWKDPRISGSQDIRTWGSRDRGIPASHDPGIPGSQDLRIPGSQDPSIPGSEDTRIWRILESQHSRMSRSQDLRIPGCQGPRIWGSHSPRIQRWFGVVLTRELGDFVWGLGCFIEVVCNSGTGPDHWYSLGKQ